MWRVWWSTTQCIWAVITGSAVKLDITSWKSWIQRCNRDSYLCIDPSCDVMESCIAVCCNIDDISPWNESNWHAQNQNTTQGPETNHWYFNEMSGSRCLRDIRDRCHDVTMSWARGKIDHFQFRCHLDTFSHSHLWLGSSCRDNATAVRMRTESGSSGSN